jgi:uncharacterized membrane protein
VAARWTSRIIGVKSSLWFEPLLMLGVALGLGITLPALDRRVFGVGPPGGAWGLWVASSASGARATLATSATALASILGISITATMVVIQLAAGMYTSRLLRRFLGDRPIRLFLGAFVGGVLYLIMVLGAIRSPQEGGQFVPLISVLVGRLLTVGCLLVLLIFVHYTARSVQAATIVERVARDALGAFRAIRKREADHPPTRDPDPPGGEGMGVRADQIGYLQVIDLRQLAECLPKDVASARIDVEAGAFLLPSSALLTLWSEAGGPPQQLDEEALTRIRAAFATGRERTVEQDPGFAIRQLTDVALKALSPAVNDPTTAVMVVNEMGVVAHEALCAGVLGGLRGARIAGRDLWIAEFGLTSVMDALSDVVDAAANQPDVLERALALLTIMRAHANTPRADAALEGVAIQVAEVAERGALPQRRLEAVRARYRAFRRT